MYIVFLNIKQKFMKDVWFDRGISSHLAFGGSDRQKTVSLDKDPTINEKNAQFQLLIQNFAQPIRNSPFLKALDGTSHKLPKIRFKVTSTLVQ